MLSESAFTAIGSRSASTVPRTAAIASSSSNETWRASRSSAWPASVGCAGLSAHHHDLAEAALQRLDPLTDRGRRHLQPPGGRVETALVDDGRERLELRGVELHDEAILMARQNL